MFWVFLWLVIGVALAILELMTFQLVSIWFVAGSAGGLIAASLGAPVWLQILLFVVISALLLATIRPFFLKKLNTRYHKTNADRNIGQTAIVTETIDNDQQTGAVKVMGSIWTARSSDGSVVEAGEKVVVESIQGVKVIVHKL